MCANYGDNMMLPPQALYLHRGGDSCVGWAPYGGKSVGMLQFGSQCRVPGASLGTDINAYRGTVPQLISLLGGKGNGMATDPENQKQNDVEAWRVEAITHLHPTVTGGPAKGEPVEVVTALAKIGTDVTSIISKLDAGTTLDDADRAAIAAAVLAGLDMAALANAVADTVVAKISALRFGVVG